MKIFKRTKQHQRVFSFIKSKKDYGATDHEISTALKLSLESSRPRRRDLVLMGQVEEHSTRVRKNKSNRSAKVWIAVSDKPLHTLKRRTGSSQVRQLEQHLLQEQEKSGRMSRTFETMLSIHARIEIHNPEAWRRQFYGKDTPQ